MLKQVALQSVSVISVTGGNDALCFEDDDLISVFVCRDISGLVSVTKYGFKDWKFLSSSPETLLFGKYRNTVFLKVCPSRVRCEENRVIDRVAILMRK
jgi:hypothetical protein